MFGHSHYNNDALSFVHSMKDKMRSPRSMRRRKQDKKNKDEEETSTSTTTTEEPLDPKDKKIIELNQQISELKNNYKFALAEIENVRKRLQKDVDRAREFGVEKLIKNLFTVTDSINICLHNKPKDISNEDTKIAFESLDSTKKTNFIYFPRFL